MNNQQSTSANIDTDGTERISRVAVQQSAPVNHGVGQVVVSSSFAFFSD